MLVISSHQRLQTCLAGIPGLVHFGASPLKIKVGKRISSVRISILGHGILNLKGLSIGHLPDNWLETTQCQMSSRHRSSNAAIDLLRGKPIHTESEALPWWDARFFEAILISELAINNRLGLWAGRSYSLCVNMVDEVGVEWCYNHLANSRILAALEFFTVRCSGLVAQLYRLPAEIRTPISANLLIFSNIVTELISQVQSELCIGTPIDGRLDQLRIKTLSELNTVIAGLRGADLISILISSRDIIDALLPRSTLNPLQMGIGVELEALAVLFASYLCDSNKVKLDRISENKKFLTDRTSVKLVESIVNRIYEETGLGKISQPIMFRAHGMSGSFLLANPMSFVQAMEEATEIFASIGYKSAICYGTFLGAVRDGGFIPHDDDVDMAILLKSPADSADITELHTILGLLKSAGVEAKIKDGYQFIAIKPPKNKVFIDIFPIIPTHDPGTVRMYMEGLKIRDVPSEVVVPFSTVSLYGTQFASPASAEGFLSERYGPTWKIPQRTVGGNTLEV